mmetsp:Transcript_31214/g.93567  ORF Transcript_31214/g.93567 Transcript_31214/m.93567 type:complete len:431 (-) Transcript_31214:813-2105(-)
MGWEMCLSFLRRDKPARQTRLLLIQLNSHIATSKLMRSGFARYDCPGFSPSPDISAFASLSVAFATATNNPGCRAIYLRFECSVASRSMAIMAESLVSSCSVPSRAAPVTRASRTRLLHIFFWFRVSLVRCITARMQFSLSLMSYPLLLRSVTISANASSTPAWCAMTSRFSGMRAFTRMTAAAPCVCRLTAVTTSASNNVGKQDMPMVMCVAILVRASAARCWTSECESRVETSERVSRSPLWQPSRSAVSTHARLVSAPAALRRALSLGSELTVFFSASRTTPDPYVASRRRFSLEKARFCKAVTAYSRVSALSSMTESLTNVPKSLSFRAIGGWLSGELAMSMRAAEAYSLAPSQRSNAAIFNIDSTRPVCSSIVTLFSSELARLARTLILMTRQSGFRMEVATLTSTSNRPWCRASGTRKSDTRLK